MLRKSLTISPDDSFQRWNALNRYTAVAASVLQQLNLKHATYEIFPEITTPTGAGLGGRIHFHGSLFISNWVGFLVDDLYKIYEIGKRSEVDDINDVDKWETYVHKDEEIMKNYCNKLGLPYGLTQHTKYESAKKGRAPFILNTLHNRPTLIEKLRKILPEESATPSAGDHESNEGYLELDSEPPEEVEEPKRKIHRI